MRWFTDMSRIEKSLTIILALICMWVGYIGSPGSSWPVSKKSNLNDYIICTGHDCIGPQE